MLHIYFVKLVVLNIDKTVFKQHLIHNHNPNKPFKRARHVRYYA